MPVFKFLTNFIKKIGEWFASLTKGAEKVWDNTEPEIKDALLKASGIVDVINKYVSKPPEFILEMLLAKFPDLPVEKIQEIVTEVAKDLNLANTAIQPDILVTLDNIKVYLAAHTGSKWARLSENIANGIAIFLAPAGTPWNKIGTIMWWVYQTFIKKAK